MSQALCLLSKLKTVKYAKPVPELRLAGINVPGCEIPAESGVLVPTSHCCFSPIPLAGRAQRTCCTSVHFSDLKGKTSEVQLPIRLSYVMLLWPCVHKRAVQNDVCVYIVCERFTRSCRTLFGKKMRSESTVLFSERDILDDVSFTIVIWVWQIKQYTNTPVWWAFFAVSRFLTSY